MCVCSLAEYLLLLLVVVELVGGGREKVGLGIVGGVVVVAEIEPAKKRKTSPVYD